ncbi:tetratricopeptide repeat protein [bacterium]|nr:tetratricopeptide repeat protein [bacterium]
MPAMRRTADRVHRSHGESESLWANPTCDRRSFVPKLLPRNRFGVTMRRSLVVPLALLASLAGIGPAECQDTPPPDPVEEKLEGPEIYRRLVAGSAWVVYVKPDGSGEYASGTGWIVDGPNRLLITNHHVVSADDESNVNAVVADKDLRVYFPWTRDGRLISDRSEYLRQGTFVKATVIDSNPTIDLAVLRLESIPAGVVPLPLSARMPEPGSQVHSIGNPGASGGMFVYTSGTVRQIYRGKREYGGGQKVEATIVETQSPANPGDSGGPVVNGRGQVVAICSAGNQKAQLMTIFIDVSELKDYLAKVRPFVRPRTADDFNNRGVQYYELGLYDKAIPDLTEAIKIDPKLAIAYVNRANAFHSKKEYDSALADLKQAKALGENTMLLHDIAGLCHIGKEDYDKAIESFTQAIGLEPGDASLRASRSDAYKAKSMFDEAVRDMTEAIRIEPGEAAHYARRALIHSDQGHHEDALRDYSEAIKIEPQNPEYYAYRAIVHENAGQLDAAAADYAESVKRTDEKADLLERLLSLGAVHHKRKDLAAEQLAYALVAKVDAQFADARVPVRRGRTLRITNKTGEKITVYLKFHGVRDDGQPTWTPSPPDQEGWANYQFEPDESAVISFQGKTHVSDKVRLYAVDAADLKGWLTYRDADLPLGVPDEGYRAPDVQEFEFTIRAD